ncbi:MAG: acyl-phosphate glycerol 3-phosphate acyltransferase [Acidobacteria bacterium]|nr:MAG: acyl-phosphate glycerol 3-phosphate acyltransferase [Acidobacteriota bacterium]PYR75921.1 MAG: acyl-phosphate glycerol 3-phosphate acyltransferase [Acidobacteriota bacterium]
MRIVVAIVAGYLLGSIPFALLLTRSRGVDLRVAGSRNVGAANVLRTTGVMPAVAVMLLDAAKGAAAILAARLLTDNLTVVMTAGLAAIVGHVYPAWLGFRGGKGVAASAGVFVMLAPLATAIAALVFVLTIFVTRFISAGSIAGALALAIATLAGNAPGPVIAGAIAAALLVMHRHRDNVSRLLAGTERRIGLRL